MCFCFDFMHIFIAWLSLRHSFLLCYNNAVVQTNSVLPLNCHPCPQSISNLAWAFATLLGEQLPQLHSPRRLFAYIRNEAVHRLQLAKAAAGDGAAAATSAPPAGVFSEQALSNLAFAFDKAALPSGGLLQHIFDTAATRLSCGAVIGFKPQVCFRHVSLEFVWLSFNV